MPYQIIATDLRDYYILAGTAAATLVGLLFVGLSLHLRIVIAASEVRSLARVTLANFGAVLFVTVSYLAIVEAGVLLSSLTSAFPSVLVVAIVVLLVVSLRNTWDLLVTVGEVPLGGEPDKD